MHKLDIGTFVTKISNNVGRRLIILEEIESYLFSYSFNRQLFVLYTIKFFKLLRDKKLQKSGCVNMHNIQN